MEYLIVKWLHVFAAMLLVGTGVGSAYYLLRTSLWARRRTAGARQVARVMGYGLKMSQWFTPTMVVFQLLSGWYLAHLTGTPLASRWILLSLIVYVSAGACWAVIVWLQVQMRNAARAAEANNRTLPRAYWQHLFWWGMLGLPVVGAIVVIFCLMVLKPY